jgi:ABC-type dipeptide/oligopeptide/nickel transport system permease subunit
MITAGQNDFGKIPHLVLVPGIAISLTVYALNLLGERFGASTDLADTTAQPKKANV